MVERRTLGVACVKPRLFQRLSKCSGNPHGLLVIDLGKEIDVPRFPVHESVRDHRGTTG